MAKIKLNPIFEEVSGAFGDLVFREVRGKTVLARKPDFSGVEPSEDQAMHRERFREAVAYGKSVMADADIRAIYEEVSINKDMPIFALTVADFFNAPVIQNVDLSAYNGQVANVIKVRASDDFGVMNVRVAITDAQNGNAVESGNAIETAPGSDLWLYSATEALTAGTLVDITVVATDRPGGMASATHSKSL